MDTSIRPIASIELPQIRPAGQPRISGGAFSDVFSQAVRKVESAGQNASAAVESFLSGEGEELHTAALAVQKADLAFEMFMQARGKVVSAYQEIMRMQM